MDISKQYINMCRQAKELQENHIWQDGDFIIVHDNVLTILGDDTITSLSKDLYQYSVSGEIKKLTPLKQCIWLPRIDQLLDMFKECDKWNHTWYKHDTPLEKIKHILACYDTFFNFVSESIETSIMQILMLERYDSVWNGEDWI